MTLVEVLVTSGILVILISLVVVLLLRTKTAWQASATRASSRQGLQEISWRVAREVQGSNPTFLTDGSTSGLEAFSFVSARGPSGTFVTDDQATPAWQMHVVYYLAPGTTRLLRKEIPRDFAANPTLLRALTQAELAAACDGQGTLMSAAATRLRLTPQADSATAILEVHSQATNAHGGLDRQSRRQTILVYNE